MVFQIEAWIKVVMLFAFIALLLWAFVDCLLRRKDAFPAIGTMPKAGWLIVLLVAMLFVWLAQSSEFIAMAGGGLAAYYLLDVRRGLREVAEGHW
ncbi:DUF2516 family protein [Catellatospora bangladeshensis]|uniref:DUF2516 family protein n=1 Tax=Catellatospora bangladeshensis TaxID=310355 RepID=A0A8J3J7G1_9ACTN|nr:DUF2516 family protein [Catellatospora bangladeshensis]GIF79532.1 hypothetical protein Cba03nite_08810 [Catellatospora bangladeshensis]